MKRIAVISALVLATLAVLPTAAQAAKRSIEAKASYLTVKGEIRSRKSACEREEFVMLFKKEDGGDIQYESGFTNRRGKFAFQNALPGGVYYVKVDKNQSDGCDAARSEKVVIGNPRQTPRLAP